MKVGPWIFLVFFGAFFNEVFCKISCAAKELCREQIAKVTGSCLRSCNSKRHVRQCSAGCNMGGLAGFGICETAKCVEVPDNQPDPWVEKIERLKRNDGVQPWIEAGDRLGNAVGSRPCAWENNGQQICVDIPLTPGFITCVNGEWTNAQSCGTGTRCQSINNGNHVLCGW